MSDPKLIHPINRNAAFLRRGRSPKYAGIISPFNALPGQRRALAIVADLRGDSISDIMREVVKFYLQHGLSPAEYDAIQNNPEQE